MKYTPEGDDFYFGSTEFSAAFDSFASVVDDGNRVTQWSDHLTFTALTQLSDKITGPHLSIAVGPQVTTILRGESGARIGAAAIARYTRGLSSGGVTCSWNGATASSDANPAGILDLGVGFGRQLAKSGFLNNLTLHANGLMEKSTGVQRTMSVFEGMEYQITNRLSVDVSGQHIHVSGGVRETQIQVGLTMNFGRPF
ncbi:MAG: hypothetical protein HYZ37_06075 [Candidatus Solibacter usitatus]|nr:hypothetical protein [Candidatus Solibacter usitatus]